MSKHLYLKYNCPVGDVCNIPTAKERGVPPKGANYQTKAFLFLCVISLQGVTLDNLLSFVTFINVRLFYVPSYSLFYHSIIHRLLDYSVTSLFAFHKSCESHFPNPFLCPQNFELFLILSVIMPFWFYKLSSLLICSDHGVLNILL